MSEIDHSNDEISALQANRELIFSVNVSVPALTTQIKLPHLSMNSYELSVVAVAVDRTTQETFAIEDPERVYRDLKLLGEKSWPSDEMSSRSSQRSVRV